MQLAIEKMTKYMVNLTFHTHPLLSHEHPSMPGCLLLLKNAEFDHEIIL